MTTISVSDVVFRQDLYPRIDHDPALVQRYQENLDVLPPIEVNQHNILIDGWHRWTAYKQAKASEIEVTVTETASEVELLRLAVVRNAAHGKQMSSADKKEYALRIYGMTTSWSGDDETRIAKDLSASSSSIRGWLARAKKDTSSAKNRQIARLWLLGHTQQEISSITGDSRENVGKIATISKITEKSGYTHDPDYTNFTAPIYDVWKLKESGNSVRHSGQSEVSFVDNLLYLYTEPGDIVIDPFAGGGSTIDICRKRLRRCFASDLTPIESRKNEIREHDITSGLLKPPQWKDVSLVYLDPPYGAQVASAYSDKSEDLANQDNDAIAPAVAEVIKAYMSKLSARSHIALIIQATQWHAENRRRVDHVWRIAELGLPMPIQRIQVPYESQQAKAQMVSWAKENREILTLSREIVVWEI